TRDTPHPLPVFARSDATRTSRWHTRTTARSPSSADRTVDCVAHPPHKARRIPGDPARRRCRRYRTPNGLPGANRGATAETGTTDRLHTDETLSAYLLYVPPASCVSAAQDPRAVFCVCRGAGCGQSGPVSLVRTGI